MRSARIAMVFALLVLGTTVDAEERRFRVELGPEFDRGMTGYGSSGDVGFSFDVSYGTDSGSRVWLGVESAVVRFLGKGRSTAREHRRADAVG